MSKRKHPLQPFRMTWDKHSKDGKWALGSQDFVRMPVGSGDRSKWFRYENYNFEPVNDLEAMSLELMYIELTESND